MAEQSISKTCRICKETKPISEFYKASGNRDGYKNECKVCTLKHDREYLRTDKGKQVHRRSSLKYIQSEKGKVCRKQYRQTEKDKEIRRRASRKYYRTKKGKAKQRIYQQSDKGREVALKAANKYSISHPERIAARHAVRQAIKDGQLPHPDSLQCSCGEPAKQYHHHKGYAPEHWLDVIPVCRKCHDNLS